MSLRGRSAAGLLAEFLVIVLGVLVALGADQWVANRADRVTEHEYLERLLDDVTTDRAENRFIVEMHGMSLAFADTLLAWLRESRLDRIDRASLVTAFGYAAEHREPDYSRGTYDELIASGRIGLIRSPAVRSALAEYDRTITEYRGAWVGRARGEFFDFRMRHFHPGLLGTFFEACYDARITEGCALDLSHFDEDRLRAELVAPERVGDLLASMGYQDTVSRLIATRIDPVAERLEAALRAEIAR